MAVNSRRTADYRFAILARIVSWGLNRGHPGLAEAAGRLEDAGKPRPSLIAVWYGSFDAWVELAVLPRVENGALAADDMVYLVACLRRWETDGTWGQASAG